MRAFAAIALLAGLVAANGGYGHEEPSTIVMTSTDVQTITSCAGGCSHTPSAPPMHTPTTIVHPSETPIPTLPTVGIPETCVPTTVTVTVTVPAGPPTVSPPAPPPVNTHTSVSPPKPTVTPSGTVKPPPVNTPTPTPSPPAFTGAASHANAGLFVAGAGAFAALFL